MITLSVRFLPLLLSFGPLAIAAETVLIDEGRKAQVWQGSGACMATWGDKQDFYLGDAWQTIFAEDIGFNILRVELSSIVLGNDGRHTYQQVDFDADPKKNLHYFHYDNPANARAGLFAEVAKGLSKRIPDLKVIGSVWTPPHWMKQGGELINFQNDSAKGTLNFEENNVEQYARYMASSVVAFEKASGAHVYALSIENEPLFENPFNSMKLTPQDYPRALSPVIEEFARLKMDTKFFGPESVIYGNPPNDTWLIDQQVEYCKQIMADPVSGKGILAFAAHGYGGDGITSDFTGGSPWAYYWDKVKSSGKQSWMTETGGGKPEEALSKFPAAIMEGMLQGDVSMWVNWQLSDGGQLSEHNLLGSDLDTSSPKYNVAKQYFRWIRPGAQRLETSPSIVPGDYSTCAWVHDQNKTATIVLYNIKSEKSLTYELPKKLKIKNFRVIQTVKGKPHQELSEVKVVGGKVSITVPPMSLTTLTNER
jgi:glucuronoarabinoxylan endo-1,4-beta-xylanase